VPRATNDLLLNKSNFLSGTHKAGVRIRPIRTTYLIHPSAANIALAAIEAACVEWGGGYNFLIPCEPAGRPLPLWQTIMERQDPDFILDLVGADQAFGEEQQRVYDRAFITWDQPTATMYIVGSTIYPVLARWKRVRGADVDPMLLHLDPLGGHSLALPLAAQFGHLSNRPVPESHRQFNRYASSKLDHFLEISTVDPANVTDERLVATLVEGLVTFGDLIMPKRSY
jgi:hypothetical protein